jgi:hypothetical protein
VQDRCMVCVRRTIGSENHFGPTGWYHLVMKLMWKLVSVLSEIVLTLTQDRCTICIEHTIGSKILLGAPDGIPR